MLACHAHPVAVAHILSSAYAQPRLRSGWKVWDDRKVLACRVHSVTLHTFSAGGSCQQHTCAPSLRACLCMLLLNSQLKTSLVHLSCHVLPATCGCMPPLPCIVLSATCAFSFGFTKGWLVPLGLGLRSRPRVGLCPSTVPAICACKRAKRRPWVQILRLPTACVSRPRATTWVTWMWTT